LRNRSSILNPHAHRMRQSPTDSEATLWRALRARQLGVEFRRQVPVLRFIVDFLAPLHGLSLKLMAAITRGACALTRDGMRSSGVRGIACFGSTRMPSGSLWRKCSAASGGLTSFDSNEPARQRTRALRVNLQQHKLDAPGREPHDASSVFRHALRHELSGHNGCNSGGNSWTATATRLAGTSASAYHLTGK